MGVSNITPTRPVLPREGTSVPIMALEIMETVIFLIVVGGILMGGRILAWATIMEEIMDLEEILELEEIMDQAAVVSIVDSATLEETMDRLEVTTSPPGGAKGQPCRAF